MPRNRTMLALAVAAVLLPLGAVPAAAAAESGPRTGAAAQEGAAPAALPQNVETFMTAYRDWGTYPSTAKYMNLFTPTGTLMDSGLDAPKERPGIEAQYNALMCVTENSYRFAPGPPTSSPSGDVIFLKARNTGHVKPAGTTTPIPFDFRTMHRLELNGSQVQQGRRFWDQTELFRSLDPTLPRLFEGMGPVAPAPAPATGPGVTPPTGGDPAQRLQAWNTRDADALVDGLTGPVRLSGPGLNGVLAGRAKAEEYLTRLFSGMTALQLAPGNRVQQGGTTFQEWVGHATVGADRPPVTFGIVESFTRNQNGGTTWDLSFDTLDLVASPDRINSLRVQLFGSPTQPAC
ncbi:nuclear transport factor 2 family protein [Streptomyces yaizuensis]|uniref:Nuclear transport factor 2 family protein n=1 Tax=Streptomyces yaizuensis TaxID=2989713 RepID=A0ABQ5P2S8_9ACTN|nr:nuclear transport factor 2 family protein [Streptomyces sp. YSPA8]GLF96885.1 nuclear transport factor 2 family protein [Streptomyces sp. YSPA8]